MLARQREQEAYIARRQKQDKLASQERIHAQSIQVKEKEIDLHKLQLELGLTSRSASHHSQDNLDQNYKMMTKIQCTANI